MHCQDDNPNLQKQDSHWINTRDNVEISPGRTANIRSLLEYLITDTPLFNANCQVVSEPTSRSLGRLTLTSFLAASRVCK